MPREKNVMDHALCISCAALSVMGFVLDRLRVGTEQDLLPPPDLEAINYRTVSENPLMAYLLFKKLYQD